jgi:hypothetical protein
MKTCRSCGAPIRWVVTYQGRRMPVDVEPAKDGNIVLEGDTAVAVGKPAKRLAYGRPGTPLYRSHFASCPQASEHRR